jgi:SsrA-binding protein
MTEGIKVIGQNKKAFHDYTIVESVEAGLILTGSEIKSVRAGHIQLRDAYAKARDGEVWLYNADIAQWPGASIYNHVPTRPRKLLLHAKQIAELVSKVEQKGYALVPLKVYIKNHRAKVELALAKGRQEFDKREAIKRREADRAIRQALRVKR